DGRNIAIHGKNPVGDEKRMARPRPVCLKQFLYVTNVIVAERQGSRARKLGSGPNTGMRESVDQNEIAFARKCGNNAGVRKITRPKAAGPLCPLQPRKPRLELAI